MKVIVKGCATDKILKSDKPINFLGTVDKKTGHIQDKTHPLYGKSVKDSVLVFPYGVGSSVGAYTIYSLKSNGCAPSAMICKKADLTVATGCALADIPLVLIGDDDFTGLNPGQCVKINTELKSIILV